MSAAPTSDMSARPRRSGFDHRTAMRLARIEYERFADLLDRLEPDDWWRPTDCEAWDVRAVAGHCLGQAQLVASPLETRRQLAAAKRTIAGPAGGDFLDAFTAHQVTKNAGLSTGDLVRRYRRLIPAAVRGRRFLPGPVRAKAMAEEQRVGEVSETWSFGYLYDVIFTRDTWMHRVDVARATGNEPHLTTDHDGAIVSDVVEEWMGRHGQPADLTLTGPAGGRWVRGRAEATAMDAVEFCRILSGRGTAVGLLSTEVPF